MLRRSELVTLVVAVAVHAGLAAALTRGRTPERPPRKPLELVYPRRVPEAAPAAVAEAAAPRPRPPEPARPRRKVAARTPTTPTPAPKPDLPPPAAAPRDDTPPAPAPVKPVFAVAMESTTTVESPVSAPVGRGSALGSPSGTGAPAGGGATGSPSGRGSDGDGYMPASELEIATMPEVDTEACGRTVTYPELAERNGIEGKVRLRVALDERGRVRAASVLAGLGYGLDQVAIDAIKHRCKFRPAISKRGEPVAFVIQSYTFRFELPR